MAIRSSSFEDELITSLTDPEEAAAYLAAAIRDSKESFLEAMSDVAKAHKMAKVAQEADVERGSLYRMLSPGGNPTWDNLSAVLDVMGLTLSVIPKSRSEDVYGETLEPKQEQTDTKVKPQIVTTSFSFKDVTATPYKLQPERFGPLGVQVPALVHTLVQDISIPITGDKNGHH